ncbi:DUF6328 family protein [Streptomyces sp. NPDC048389]|uniref:DUF6328 family protein n=1 Tax=Streptomyces sp. NPDC048389 TaxID=3154622 RepID=UPI003453E5A6
MARTGPGERRESEGERLDRLWGELLREVRVVLAGVQLLFVFLLAVAFTPLFTALGDVDRAVYVACLLLGATAIGVLVAPVGIHRMVTGRGLKFEAARWGSRLTFAGVVLLLGMVGLALLLVLRSVPAISDTAALVMAAALVGALMLCWLVPAAVMRRGDRSEPDGGSHPDDRRRSAP